MCRVRASGTSAKDRSPRGPAWRATSDRPLSRATALRRRPVEAEALVQDNRIARRRLKRASAADRERRRPAAPCAAALQRVEVMPEAYFKVRPERSFAQSARDRRSGLHRALAWLRDPPLPRQIRHVPVRAAARRRLRSRRAVKRQFNGQQNAYRRDPSGGNPGGRSARQSSRGIRLRDRAPQAAPRQYLSRQGDAR